MLTILCGDALEQLRTLPDESVQCCVCSPPYWGLRDYGVVGQLGLEKTPDEYVAKMVEVFREMRRVLKNDGTLWLNLGDSYFGGGRGGNPEESAFRKQATNTGSLVAPTRVPLGCKPKDLVGIPWLVAFALRADGWWLRQDIIWSKPNPMPESVTDRCTKSHEYLFLLTKSARYYYDAEAIAEQQNFPGRRYNPDKSNHKCANIGLRLQGGLHDGREQHGNGSTRNKRSVWTVPTAPFRGDACDGTNRKLSKDCPIHGYLAVQSRARLNGEQPTVSHSARNHNSGDDLFQVPSGVDCASKEDQCETLFGECVATYHNNEIRKTEDVSGPDGTSVDKPASNIECKERSDHSYAMSGRIHESRNAADNQGGESCLVSEQISPDKTGKCACVEYGDLEDEKQDHFAVFPPDLIKPCILAGSKPGDTILDPFAGSGTTGMVALELGRKALLIELNPQYVKLIERRCAVTPGLKM